jgi:hypothetical protein
MDPRRGTMDFSFSPAPGVAEELRMLSSVIRARAACLA